MKLLISAYMCEPDANSESTVAWEWVTRLSKHHEVVVITRASTQQTSSIVVSSSLRIEYCALPCWMTRSLDHPDYRHTLYYNVWQVAAYRRAKRLLRAEAFDVVHHLVYVSTWQPTYMAFLGIPFVLGPVGENPLMPMRVAIRYGMGFCVHEIFKRMVRVGAKRYFPLMRMVYSRAAHVMAISSVVASEVTPLARSRTSVEPAVSAPERPGLQAQSRSPDEDFRVIFVGRFVPVKAPDIALQAFAHFAADRDNVRLVMIGGGPMAGVLKQLAHRDPRIDVRDWLSTEEVQALFAESHVFIFPSFEGAGMVVMEAMALGLPVVCLNFGGPGEYVSDKAGIKVPIGTAEELIRDLAQALEQLYSNEALRRAKMAAAREHYQSNYAWVGKINRIDKIYANARLQRCRP